MKLTPFPNKLHLPTGTYDIIYKDLTQEAAEGKDNYLYGLTLHEKAIIFINTTIESQISLKQTVMHEIIHAFEEHYGMKFTENECDALANAFIYFLQNNDTIIKQLRVK